MKKSSTLRKIFSVVGKYNLLLVLSLLFSLVTVFASLYVPVLTGRAIDLVIGKNAVDMQGVLSILIKIGIVVIAAGVSQWLVNFFNNKVSFNVVRDLRKRAFGKLSRLPLSYIDSHKHGDIISRIISDADRFSDGLLIGFTQFFTGLVTIIATIVFMLFINAYITLIVVLVTPLSIVVARFIARKTYAMFRKQTETRGEMTSFIEESVAGHRVIKAYSNEGENLKKFDRINDEHKKYSLKAIFYSSIANPSTRFINGVVYASVAVFGAVSIVSGGAMTVGKLSAFLSYATQYTKPFNEISGVLTELQNALACAERIFDLLEEDEEEDDSDKNELIYVKGNVKIDDVSFSYTKTEKLIKDLSLDVGSGQRVAIVGPTGCGKTTLINLLMRFYDVDGGSISVDGDDVRTLKRNSLRSSYGMVLQDTWLFAGTVRDNIKFGKPDASDEEVTEAAKKAHAHGFIRRLPQGYDTLIDESGEGLSQGQKQLLCISRVMLCRPPMLILDEATSSIDTRTEHKIQDAFALLSKGKTSFIVAHRLSTIKNADVILVMKDGDVIEKGKHEELLEKKGFYHELYTSQYS